MAPEVTRVSGVQDIKDNVDWHLRCRLHAAASASMDVNDVGPRLSKYGRGMGQVLKDIDVRFSAGKVMKQIQVGIPSVSTKKECSCMH